MEKIKTSDILKVEQKAKGNNHNFKNRNYTVEYLLMTNTVVRALHLSNPHKTLQGRITISTEEETEHQRVK